MDGNDIAGAVTLAHSALAEHLKASDPQLVAALSRGVLHVVVEAVDLGDILRAGSCGYAAETVGRQMREAGVIGERATFALLVAEHLARQRLAQSDPPPVRSLRDVFADRGFTFPSGR
jgi:hypothetical protein